MVSQSPGPLAVKKRLPRLWWVFMGVVWLGLVGVGLGILVQHENAPGLAALPPAHWPGESQLRFDPSLPTLVMVIHPFCPCSKASVGELAKLMTQCDGKLNAAVVFSEPEVFDTALQDADLWQMVGRMPGVRRFADPKAAESKRFHAFTSGQTLLYDTNGVLQFCGGLTPARGHAGENVGRSAIAQFVRGGKSDHFESFVFGCPL